MRKLLLLSMLLIVSLANAQNTTTAPPPTILSFTAELPEDTPRTVSAMENGDIEITLSWVISEGNDTLYRPELSTYRIREWLTIDDEDEDQVYWPFVGTRTLDLQHPLTFSEPTYRLQIINNRTAEVVDERFITVPYEADEMPVITSFSVTGEGFDNQLQIQWSVSNRIPTSNLIFEQILDDGSAVNIELPRPTLWINSEGRGMLEPQLQNGTQDITLQLSVVDVLTDEVYDSMTITQTVTRQDPVAAAPTTIDPIRPTQPPVGTTEPENCLISPLDVPVIGYPGDGCNSYTDPETGDVARITTVNLNTWVAEPGGTVTFTWSIDGADTAIVETYNLGQLNSTPNQLFTDQPLQGSVGLDIPADFEDGIRIIVWAANRAPNSLYQRLAYEIIDLTPPYDPTKPTEIETDVAYQEFEHGFMVWTSFDNQIWVFTNSGQVYFYANYSALPDNPITDEAPTGLVKPISGFGKVWGSYETIREALGWALSAEQGYSTTVEYYYPQGSYIVHYIIPLPSGRRVETRETGIWEEATR